MNRFHAPLSAALFFRCVSRVLVGWAPVLLLGACALVQPNPAPPNAAIELASRAYQPVVNLSGRLSVRYEAAGKPEALHGNFTWSQTPQLTTITLRSPLGQTLALIELTPAGATLRQSAQPLRSAADADALAAEVLGWPLPVAGLRDWLQGFVLNNTGQRINAIGHAAELQNGWRVEFDQWQFPTPQQAYPKRIDLSRSTQQAGDVAIRIALDDWQIP